MSIEISVIYEGDLRTRAEHGPSGEDLLTDAPIDNRGRGETFSPTDLVATGLGTCMLTLMGIAARERDLDITGSTVTVTKIMVADPHRRIAALPSTIRVPIFVLVEHQRVLEHAARNCPVQNSLDPRIEREVTFEWAPA